MIKVKASQVTYSHKYKSYVSNVMYQTEQGTYYKISPDYTMTFGTVLMVAVDKVVIFLLSN